MQSDLPFTSVKKLAQKYKYFIFDCDGVLWHGNKMIGNAFRNIEYLESLGKKVFFVTNASGMSRKKLAQKMISDGFGYSTVKIENLYTAATLAGLYVKLNLPDCKKVRYIGMPAMGEELESHGINIEGGMHGNPEFDKPEDFITLEQVDEYELDPDIGAVISGFDYGVNYSKYQIASLYLQEGRKWIVTNEDAYSTTTKGRRFPGNGSCQAVLQNMLKNSKGDGLICDKVVTGKPNPEILNTIRAHHNIPEEDLSQFIMIGDNPSTDIALGHNSKIDTCLVFTGCVKNVEDAHEWMTQSEKFKPTYVMESWGEDI